MIICTKTTKAIEILEKKLLYKMFVSTYCMHFGEFGSFFWEKIKTSHHF